MFYKYQFLIFISVIINITKFYLNAVSVISYVCSDRHPNGKFQKSRSSIIDDDTAYMF